MDAKVLRTPRVDIYTSHITSNKFCSFDSEFRRGGAELKDESLVFMSSVGAEDDPWRCVGFIVAGFGEVDAGDGGVRCPCRADDSFVNSLGAFRR